MVGSDDPAHPCLDRRSLVVESGLFSEAWRLSNASDTGPGRPDSGFHILIVLAKGDHDNPSPPQSNSPICIEEPLQMCYRLWIFYEYRSRAGRQTDNYCTSVTLDFGPSENG